MISKCQCSVFLANLLKLKSPHLLCWSSCSANRSQQTVGLSVPNVIMKGVINQWMTSNIRVAWKEQMDANVGTTKRMSKQANVQVP